MDYKINRKRKIKNSQKLGAYGNLVITFINF